ncbi:MAG: hypothetical protein AB1646_21040 [Thermodesulfobacteriota bacterium]
MQAKTFEMEFAKFIQRFSEEIKESFLQDAFDQREILAHYRLGKNILEELASNILSEFTRNVDRRTHVELIADEYMKMGLNCHEEQLSSAEVIRVFILLKRHIWLFFQESNFAGQPFDVRSIVALNNRIALFFDRAMYYFLVGFEEAEDEESSELEVLYRKLLSRIRRDLGIPQPGQ